MRENEDQKNFQYGQFLRDERQTQKISAKINSLNIKLRLELFCTYNSCKNM